MDKNKYKYMCKNPLLTIKRNGRVLSLEKIKKASESTYTTEESKNIIQLKHKEENVVF